MPGLAAAMQCSIPARSRCLALLPRLLQLLPRNHSQCHRHNHMCCNSNHTLNPIFNNSSSNSSSNRCSSSSKRFLSLPVGFLRNGSPRLERTHCHLLCRVRT